MGTMHVSYAMCLLAIFTAYPAVATRVSIEEHIQNTIATSVPKYLDKQGFEISRVPGSNPKDDRLSFVCKKGLFKKCGDPQTDGEEIVLSGIQESAWTTTYAHCNPKNQQEYLHWSQLECVADTQCARYGKKCSAWSV